MKQVTVLFGGRRQGVFLLDEPHVVIGRGRSAHIALDGNPIVSRQHAVIRADQDSHVLEDLGGANGTYLNDALVSQARLRAGDRIVLGKHTLRYEEATPEAASLAGRSRAAHDNEDDVQTRRTEVVGDSASGETEAAEEPGQRHALKTARRGAPPPWAAPASLASAGGGGSAGSERTVAATRHELENLLEQMKVKAGPHLSINREGRIDLIALTDPPVLVGYTDACRVRLAGRRWVGRVAASLYEEGGAWWIHACSAFWNPVTVGSSRVRTKRKLMTGTAISVGDLRARFSQGEQP